jgi:hypothetical protein
VVDKREGTMRTPERGRLFFDEDVLRGDEVVSLFEASITTTGVVSTVVVKLFEVGRGGSKGRD